jgi:hypothetical protein
MDENYESHYELYIYAKENKKWCKRIRICL